MVLRLLRAGCSREKRWRPTSDTCWLREAAVLQKDPGGAWQSPPQTLLGMTGVRAEVGGAVLTAADVSRREGVIREDVGGLRYLQIHHVGGVLQGCDSVFVSHLLQAATVDLKKRPSEMDPMGVHLGSGLTPDLQLAVCLQSAGVHLYGQLLLQ